MKNKIIVTGGCGFIGSCFVKYLLDNYSNIIVYNFDSLTYASNKKNLLHINNNNYHFTKLDISNYSLLKKKVLSISPDAIFNFAAETHVDNSIVNSRDFINTNIIGTYNFLKILTEIKLKYSVKKFKKFRFIQISTDEVYGSLSSKGFFTEKSLIDPSSPYSASKASSELLCKAWYKTYNLPILITNSSNNYGPNQHTEKFIPTIIRSLIKRRKIPLYGNGKNTRDWIFVEDNVNAIYSIYKKGKIGENYNIGSNQELNNIQLIKKILNIYNKIMNKKLIYNNVVKHVPDRLGHDFRYALSTNKIRKNLNWKPKFKIDEALELTIQSYLK